MPWLTIEYSKNIHDEIAIDANFISELHQLIADTIATKVMNCKTKVFPVESYFIGDTIGEQAFILCSIKILAGRTKEIKDTLQRRVAAFFNDKLRFSLATDICVLIEDLQHYEKLTTHAS